MLESPRVVPWHSAERLPSESTIEVGGAVRQKCFRNVTKYLLANVFSHGLVQGARASVEAERRKRTGTNLWPERAACGGGARRVGNARARRRLVRRGRDDDANPRDRRLPRHHVHGAALVVTGVGEGRDATNLQTRNPTTNKSISGEKTISSVTS